MATVRWSGRRLLRCCTAATASVLCWTCSSGTLAAVAFKRPLHPVHDGVAVPARETRKIAGWAEGHFLRMATHNPLGPGDHSRLHAFQHGLRLLGDPGAVRPRTSPRSRSRFSRSASSSRAEGRSRPRFPGRRRHRPACRPSADGASAGTSPPSPSRRGRSPTGDHPFPADRRQGV
jgi:hypothetical protein